MIYVIDINDKRIVFIIYAFLKLSNRRNKKLYSSYGNYRQILSNFFV